MRSTLYLYGIMPKDLKKMNYEDAINAKLKGVRNLIEKAQDYPLEVRDTDYIRELVDARKFNEKLLQEMQ